MTAPHYTNAAVTLWHGDALRILPTLPDCSVDAVVTDPPYELAFMGRAWDASGIASRVDLWEEVLRVLKPGGHLLAFGGTRTWHRLTCAIEDAGFEIRDTITWLYGSGFPKSLDVGKAIDKAAGATREVIGRATYPNGVPVRSASPDSKHDGWRRPWMDEDADTNARRLVTAPATDDAARWDGWGTALKPASEPVVVARKPLTGTVAQTVLTYGTGALNIDDCRVATSDDLNGGAYSGEYRRQDRYVNTDTAPGAAQLSRLSRGIGEYQQPQGRWPANVVLTHPQADDGGDACAEGCVPGCPVADLDTQSGGAGGQASGTTRTGRHESHSRGAFNGTDAPAPFYTDEGGASRFFPTFRYQAKADTAQRPRAGATAHPTVKPLDLMRWLVRLVTPPGGTVLDLFAGSGTTGEACTLEGFRALLIEREADYLPLIVDRLTRRTDPVAHLTAKAARGEAVDLGLFADLEDGTPA
jgi:DNA modification methylase